MWLLTNRPDGPGKDQSWVTRLFVWCFLFSLIEKFSATHIGKNPTLSLWNTESMERGRSQTCSTSFTIDFSKDVVLILS